MDAGGLAQMTYNMSLNGGGGGGSSLGVPGSGFASRGKGAHIKRLNLPPHTSHLGDDASRPLPSAGPRTSRSHLLAGLRTAPKQQQQQPPQQQPPSTPATAPLFRDAQNGVPRGSQQLPQTMPYTANIPHTTAGLSFPGFGNAGDYFLPATMAPQMYSRPEHVLAPPPIDFSGEQMDEKLYAELVSANLYLAAQQQRLQQQLATVTAAAQQFQNLNLGLSPGMQQHQQPQVFSPGFQTPLSSAGLYQQQVPQSMQSIVQAVPGQPGVYCVYNPVTGQQDFVVDESVQELAGLGSPQEQFPEDDNKRNNNIPRALRQEVPSPTERQAQERRSPVSQSAPSPPRTAQSPTHDQAPTPTSAGSKRNAHRKGSSMALKVGTDTGRAGGTSGTPKSSVFPPTPATGTFGPGQGRAGEHPIRQPRGPPSIEELIAKPTSKHEGSKNFATRQRRRAVHSLVRAGMERRGGGNTASGGSVTPTSESDFNFSPAEGDEAGDRSASVSSRPSVGSLRGGASAAIGSERKELQSPRGREGKRDGGEGQPPTTADIVAGRNRASPPAANESSAQRRRMPMFVLSSAEKRKSPKQQSA
ncbi:hypothetical protein VTO42DRAFT_2971 [Malbranchea cinnamomea]